MQAFIKTAATIYKKIQDGVFDVSNEVSFFLFSFLSFFTSSVLSLLWKSHIIILEYGELVGYLISVYLMFLQSGCILGIMILKWKTFSWFKEQILNMLINFVWFQSYGIKVGYGGIPGPSGGRDGPSASAGGCCSWREPIRTYLHQCSPLCLLFFYFGFGYEDIYVLRPFIKSDNCIMFSF